MIIIFLFVIVVTLVLWRDFYKRPNEPPVLEGSLPLIGHAHLLLGNTKKLWATVVELGEASNTKGHPLTVKIGNMKIYVLSDPDDCYTVAQNCVKRPETAYEIGKDLWGSGLISSNDPIWSQRRKLINSMFNQRILDGFVKTFNSFAQEVVEKFKNKEEKGLFDHLVYLQEIAIKNSFSNIVGTNDNVNKTEIEKFIQAFTKLKEMTIERFQNIWLQADLIYNWTNSKRIFDINIKILRQAVRKLFELKKLKFNETEKHHKASSVLDLLILLKSKYLTGEDILDEIIALLLSAYDTTALTLTYTMIMIGSYPSVQERLYEEIKAVVGDCNLDKNNISKLIYLEAVIKETIRLYSLIPIIPRYIEEDIKINNYTLYKGHVCFLMINAMHKHPKWGQQVNEFFPERWLRNDTVTQHSRMFGGFGIGRRNCIGQVYSMMNLKITLAHIIMNFKIHGNCKEIINKFEITLVPDSGHYISLSRRYKK